MRVASHSRVFHAHRKGQEIHGNGGSEIYRKMPRNPKAREAKKIVPKSAFWGGTRVPKSTAEVSFGHPAASGGQKKPTARKKAQDRPKSGPMPTKGGPRAANIGPRGPQEAPRRHP